MCLPRVLTTGSDRRVHRRGREGTAATPEVAAEPRYLREVVDVFIADSMDLPLDMVEPILDARETYGVLAGLVPEECYARTSRQRAWCSASVHAPHA